jgi:hypothetical protein
MIYHMKMASPHYVCVDVPSVYSDYWMIYYRHNKNVDTRHHVSVDVHSQDSGKKQQVLEYIWTQGTNEVGNYYITKSEFFIKSN